MKLRFLTSTTKWGLLFMIVVLGTTFQCNNDDPPIPDDQLPGLTYLGRGYDFFGEYADGNSTKNQLIEFEDYTKAVDAFGVDYAVPSEVDYLMTNRNDVTSTFGQTILDYQSSLSTYVGVSGSYLGFNASVNVNFDETFVSHSDYSFLTVKNLVSLLRISLPVEVETLRSMLTEEAENDLELLDPDDLFFKYGHFLIAEAVIGARADYSASAKITETFTEEKFKISAKLSYNSGVGSISVEAGSSEEEQINEFEENSDRNCITKGGASHLGGNNILAGNYDAWLATVESDPVLCDFTNRSLVPLWELTTSDARKAQIQQRFEELVEENKFNPTAADLIISSLKIIQIYRSSDKDIDDPTLLHAAKQAIEGFQILPQNLNGGGSYATFIAYKLEPIDAADTRYYDLRLNYYHGGEERPEGYERITCGNDNGEHKWNLNHGNGGSEIELVAKKAIGDDVIRRLKVVVNPPINPPEGFEWVLDDYGNPGELDRKVSANNKLHMYLAYSKVSE